MLQLCLWLAPTVMFTHIIVVSYITVVFIHIVVVPYISIMFVNIVVVSYITVVFVNIIVVSYITVVCIIVRSCCFVDLPLEESLEDTHNKVSVSGILWKISLADPVGRMINAYTQIGT